MISSDSEEDEPISNMDEIIVISSDSEEDDLDHEQTGRGEKRKAQNQNEEQEQDYYQIKPLENIIHRNLKWHLRIMAYVLTMFSTT